MDNPTASYFITTPYVDAYERDYDSSISGGKPKITFHHFELAMKAQAYQWGEMGVGRAFITGKTPATRNSRFVLAFGTWNGKSYLALARLGSSYDVDVVEGESNPEWDVT